MIVIAKIGKGGERERGWHAANDRRSDSNSLYRHHSITFLIKFWAMQTASNLWATSALLFSQYNLLIYLFKRMQMATAASASLLGVQNPSYSSYTYCIQHYIAIHTVNHMRNFNYVTIRKWMFSQTLNQIYIQLHFLEVNSLRISLQDIVTDY